MPAKQTNAAIDEGAAVADARFRLLDRLGALVGLGPDSWMRQRLSAWWDGHDLPERPAESAAPQATASAEKKDDPRRLLPDRWSPDRIKVSELIWSDGFTFPGGAEHVLKLVKPLGLTKERTILDLGSGLGGAARLIAKTFGTWVTGMEASPTLAKAGMFASEMAGLAKRAPIEWFDPRTVVLQAKKYDAVFARLVFLSLADKKRLLAEIYKALKPGGQLMFIEFVLRAKDATGPKVQAWVSGEEQKPELWTLDEYKNALASSRFDVRVTEDITAEFRGLVLEGWKRLAQNLQPKALKAEEIASLTREIELWSRRIGALDSGDLRMVRLTGLKNA